MFLVYMGIIMYGEKVSIRMDVIFPDEEGDGRGSQA